MTELSREACIELGALIPTNPLVGWATEQLSVAKSREDRLKNRGIHPPFLKELKRLIGKVGEQQSGGKDSTPPSTEFAKAQRIREEAYRYWQEASQIVKIEFGTQPQVQADFHLGVRTGRLIGNLIQELEFVTARLRAHAAELCWLGVDEDFLKSGETLLGKLKEAHAGVQAACRELPQPLAEQCCEKGKLYDLTRKLVRIGQLEFLHEPEQAAAFNYALVRKDLRVGSEVRVKILKDAAHQDRTGT